MRDPAKNTNLPRHSRETVQGAAFACALALAGFVAPDVAAMSARNPYPPVNDNGTVGDAAGTDTAAYLNDDRRNTEESEPAASGTNIPPPAPDVPGPSSNPATGSGLGPTGGSGGDGASGGAPGSGSGSGAPGSGGN